MWHGHVTWSWAALRETQPRCVSTECGLGFTLAIWAFRSRFSTSRLRFSPRAVDKEASLELSRASRSLSLCSAPVRSDSFLPFLQRTAENGNEKKWLEKLCGWPFRGKTFFCYIFTCYGPMLSELFILSHHYKTLCLCWPLSFFWLIFCLILLYFLTRGEFFFFFRPTAVSTWSHSTWTKQRPFFFFLCNLRTEWKLNQWSVIKQIWAIFEKKKEKDVAVWMRQTEEKTSANMSHKARELYLVTAGHNHSWCLAQWLPWKRPGIAKHTVDVIISIFMENYNEGGVSEEPSTHCHVLCVQCLLWWRGEGGSGGGGG